MQPINFFRREWRVRADRAFVARTGTAVSPTFCVSAPWADEYREYLRHQEKKTTSGHTLPSDTLW